MSNPSLRSFFGNPQPGSHLATPTQFQLRPWTLKHTCPSAAGSVRLRLKTHSVTDLLMKHWMFHHPECLSHDLLHVYMSHVCFTAFADLCLAIWVSPSFLCRLSDFLPVFGRQIRIAVWVCLPLCVCGWYLFFLSLQDCPYRISGSPPVKSLYCLYYEKKWGCFENYTYNCKSIYFKICERTMAWGISGFTEWCMVSKIVNNGREKKCKKKVKLVIKSHHGTVITVTQPANENRWKGWIKLCIILPTR